MGYWNYINSGHVLTGCVFTIWASLVAQWHRVHLPSRKRGFDPFDLKDSDLTEQLNNSINIVLINGISHFHVVKPINQFSVVFLHLCLNILTSHSLL